MIRPPSRERACRMSARAFSHRLMFLVAFLTASGLLLADPALAQPASTAESAAVANAASPPVQPSPSQTNNALQPAVTPIRFTPTTPAPNTMQPAQLQPTPISTTAPPPSLAADAPARVTPLPTQPDLNNLPVAQRSASERRALEARLFQGLDWAYCGPRPGVEQVRVSPPTPPDNQRPIDITADRIDYDRGSEIVRLGGDIEIQQGWRRLEAQHSTYNRRSGALQARDRIFLDYPGMRLVGDRLDYNLLSQAGQIERVGFRLNEKANLHGAAQHARLLDANHAEFTNLTYTACPPGRADWSLRARRLALDRADGLGTARHATLYAGPLPVLYTPYLSFPLDSRRRSGLLMPTFGSSEDTGIDIRLPVYLNLAPNLDATLTPRIMSSRGLMLGGQLRYLDRFQAIELEAEILPQDHKARDKGTRGALHVTQQGRFTRHLSSSIDFAAVSDNTYLEDFGNQLDVTSQRNLSRRGDLRYDGSGWNALLRLQDFQTVDSNIRANEHPYGQLPHIELNLEPNIWRKRIEYGLTAQYDYFEHDARVHGSRFVAIPTLRAPLRRGYGALEPRLRLIYTAYNLIDQDPGKPTRPSHLIPSLDIDSKLIFERSAQWFGAPIVQTLEPRLYYLYTPHVDQSDTPQFDTTSLDFSFSSLFRANRFTGYDRIGDANQLTLGLTSRGIDDDTGETLFSASLGQIYYFADRRVQLQGTPPDTGFSSALAGELTARLFRDWSALASLQWNPHADGAGREKQMLQLRYADEDDRLFNLAYRYNLGNDSSERYEDTDLSFLMPVGNRVRFFGRWLYSLRFNETIEAFAGIEYGKCCWRVRLLGEHLKRSADNPGRTSVMLQLELAGLGSIGSQIDRFLERRIHGYQSD